jgi:23S rRNA (uridine2552-2'-O)-methyltransferase
MDKKGFRNSKQSIKTAKGRTSSSIHWLKRNLNDPYIKLAKQQSYRSRAAFKLIQINEKFRIFTKAKSILDLGCAPGGWLQVVQLLCPSGTHIVGVDLQAVEAIAGVKIIKGDFYSDDTVKEVICALNGKADVILSDMAASASGLHETDHLRSMALVEAAFEFAQAHLNLGGNFIAKILKGGEETKLLLQLRKHFHVVKFCKPDATYGNSSESYIVALGFKK